MDKKTTRDSVERRALVAIVMFVYNIIFVCNVLLCAADERTNKDIVNKK